MPELPEVEAVRRGLERHLLGREVGEVEVLDPRALRRQDGGVSVFRDGLAGRRIEAAVRRGKFLWLVLDDGNALSAHLGMSGQLLVRGTTSSPARDDASRPQRTSPVSDFLGDPAAGTVDLTATRAPSLVRDLDLRPRHLRVRLHLSSRRGDPASARGAALDLVDQRMLGGLRLSALVPTADGGPGGEGSRLALLPQDAAHVARDLLDPAADLGQVLRRMRASRRAVKAQLLDQELVSGIGNIYADEGLWAARVHGGTSGTRLGPRVGTRLLQAVAEVMRRALAAGGTSFDALYVDAEGAAGFFARELQAYGRAGQACRRCGTQMRREVLTGRSHTFCPRCQRPQR
ncbi:bifunctional DNA-formamidopyrimidine glycosylase/DNA-(apurinic or apyrimidinic site) lyase [Actinomyces faecalis]|uniref:bifunctional DNA-formamidopyrimidine glycosylase/DNA-(apurinic or apyrimidinic site) lyase n=1 Tax=Actinomyces faecalis TaxID=2722820 RepID=UPI0015569DF2|nr:bifunctional DNA-formamidopyrimidine glycosylase/DNA-(apurinic or apyrimidinic site) lyase [Actinomyces faecalis]